ncbi:MAG: DUF1501 domain-containing protein [Pseudomonadota bacterium]
MPRSPLRPAPLDRSRREFLRLAGATGLGVACSAAASPLRTPIAFAATPGENRLVVIVLRGAMDGLDVVAPYADPAYARLRPNLQRGPENGAVDLDGFFALHEKLSPLLPLWRSRELAFVHAVSTPYRDGRSHFDGQDVLETGAGDENALDDGWLNRALRVIPGAQTAAEVRYAMSIGRSSMLLLEGDAPAGSWAPSTRLNLGDDERGLLDRLYEKDPEFHAIAEEAFDISDSGMQGDRGRESGDTLAAFAADMLKGPSRIAAFSIGGWDTHRRQQQAIRRPLDELSKAVLTLREQLGDAWGKTAVVAITEFGRTARENGDRGTDHGTGGVVVLAGGAVKGGRIWNGPGAATFGGWPGLDDADLYRQRDLLPTDDLRRIPAWALVSLMGAPRSAVARSVFPGVDLGGDPGIFA